MRVKSFITPFVWQEQAVAEEVEKDAWNS